MAAQVLDIRTVAVVGAGVSGVAAAVHLKRAGLEVCVYERSRRAGGIWVYDDNVSKDPAYPSTTPSVGDSPEYERSSSISKHRYDVRRDSPMRDPIDEEWPEGVDQIGDLRTSFAPPGPCYQALRNNVSTIEMEMTIQAWREGTPEFVPHHILADYIQDAAVDNGLTDSVSFNTRVNDVRKVGKQWRVEADRLVEDDDEPAMIESSTSYFDAIVIATGHYHACSVPDLPGLASWKRQFPHSVQHSKLYRSAERFRGKNILLIGSGVSSIDIARDLGGVARTVYQSSRGGPYDLPSYLLPTNGARVGAIRSFSPVDADFPNEDGSIPGKVVLESGIELCGIHHVIVCTGYHVSFPFMREYHRDGVMDVEADETCLSASGQQTHNLHKDIFYIADPTLAVVGAPYHVATFSCFEFQAMAVATVFSGCVSLPSRKQMREEYVERLRQKGAGRTFHSLKGFGNETAYVDELVSLVNEARTEGRDGPSMAGHTQNWYAAYLRRIARQKILFSQSRDPELDRVVIEMIEGC